MISRALRTLGLITLFFTFITALPTLAAQTCPDAPLPRLVVGEQARVTPGDLPNNVRAQPGTSGQYLGEIPAGAFFTVLEGPTCGSGFYWWRVRYNTLEGWTPEGDASEYWLEPQRLIPTPTGSPTPTASPTFTPTATATITLTPSITPTPTITPTLLPMFATAVALGFDLQVESGIEWRPVSVVFNDVEMVLVPAGCYEHTITPQQAIRLAQVCEQTRMAEVMACSADEYQAPQNNTPICFEQPFWIDRYEVSMTQYEQYLTGEDVPHSFNFVRWSDDHPRGDVPYDQAVRHCFLRGGRVPLDVEWEYAARGPDNWLFTWGDFFEPNRGVYDATAEKFYNSDGSFIVKSVPVNDEMLLAGDRSWVDAYHMGGNVSEWVTVTLPDEYLEYTIRGANALDPATELRTYNWPATGRHVPNPYIGFRCVRDFQIEDLALVGR